MRICPTNNFKNRDYNSRKNVAFNGAMSERIRHALTDDNDFILKQYYDEIKNIKPVSRKEEILLASQIMQGGEKAEEAKQKLIISALPSIVYFAITLKSPDMSLADIIQEASYAVVRLFNETPYDGRKPLRNFIYDTIYRRTHKAITEKSRLIKLPMFIFDNVQIVKEAQERLEKRLSRTPSDKEISQETGFGIDRIKFLKRVGLPTEPFNKKNRQKAHVAANIFNTKYEDAIGKQIDIEQLRNYLKASLTYHKLTPLQREILAMRFPLDGVTEEKTFSAIGKKYNVTKQSVRIVLSKGIRKICRFQTVKSSDKIKLNEFLEYSGLFE